jgi:hypothetical protein
MATIRIEYTRSWEDEKDVVIVQKDGDEDVYETLDMMASVMLAATFHPDSIIDAMENYIIEHKDHKEDENV